MKKINKNIITGGITITLLAFVAVTVWSAANKGPKKEAEVFAQTPKDQAVELGGQCANKIKGVRAVVFYGQMSPKDKVDVKGVESNDTFEIVQLAREHNNANVISVGTRFVTEDEAKFAIELFLATKFSGEERHIRRINKF